MLPWRIRSREIAEGSLTGADSDTAVCICGQTGEDALVLSLSRLPLACVMQVHPEHDYIGSDGEGMGHGVQRRRRAVIGRQDG